MPDTTTAPASLEVRTQHVTVIPGVCTDRTLKRPVAKKLAELRQLLELAWCADTSAGGFTDERPATGHCAVTAMVVQDHLGGAIIRVPIPGGSHYFNRLDRGATVDLTRDQFDEYLPGEEAVRLRGELEANDTTFARYRALVARLEAGSAAERELTPEEQFEVRLAKRERLLGSPLPPHRRVWSELEGPFAVRTFDGTVVARDLSYDDALAFAVGAFADTRVGHSVCRVSALPAPARVSRRRELRARVARTLRSLAAALD